MFNQTWSSLVHFSIGIFLRCLGIPNGILWDDAKIVDPPPATSLTICFFFNTASPTVEEQQSGNAQWPYILSFQIDVSMPHKSSCLGLLEKI